jgi:CubicO group peptidase (beta-lactamase class C family)
LKGYGKADQTGRSVTPQTPFLLASVSKPITATAIMQLVEAGKIELDASVQRYVPDFRVADPVASGQITVRHLLLHTSGIPITACDTRVNSDTLAEYVAELQTVLLDAPVGTRHIYCSGNYNVLGRVIETVSGQSFGSYVQHHIFAPLEMPHSFVTEEEARRAGMAQGYQWLFGLLVPTHHRFNPSQLPSGFMISSAEDMSHFLVAQLNGGRYGSTSLLSANSVAAMQLPGTRRGENDGYGLGWTISPVGEVPAVWHSGDHPNFHTMLLLQPEKRRGAVLLLNSFGLVASLSAYREIESGVSRLLAELEPTPRQGMSLGRIYLIVDVLFAALLAIALWPLLNMRRWYRGLLKRQQEEKLPLVRTILRSAFEIGFALFFLIGIRVFVSTALGAQSWSELLSTFPDIVVWIWAVALIGIVTGVIRLVLTLRTRRTAAHSGLAAQA